MATTIVPKGSGRGTAAAKKAKHDQRTPLPPRSPRSSAAKTSAEVITDELAVAKSQLAAVKEANARKRAPKAPTRGDVPAPRRRNPRRVPGQATLAGMARDAAKKVAAPAPKPEPATEPTGGQVKAYAFAESARSAGWEVRVTTEDETTTALASRGEESIEMVWFGTRARNEVWYKFNGRTVNLRNASGARKQMAKTVEAASAESRPAARPARAPKARAAGSEPTGDEEVRGIRPKTRELPFNIDATLDDKVFASLLGTRIRSWNATAGKVDLNVFPRDSKNHKMTTGNGGRRIITFATEEGFFTSVALENIIEVR